MKPLVKFSPFNFLVIIFLIIIHFSDTFNCPIHVSRRALSLFPAMASFRVLAAAKVCAQDNSWCIKRPQSQQAETQVSLRIDYRCQGLTDSDRQADRWTKTGTA
jgi:hypothetical protein